MWHRDSAWLTGAGAVSPLPSCSLSLLITTFPWETSWQAVKTCTEIHEAKNICPVTSHEEVDPPTSVHFTHDTTFSYFTKTAQGGWVRWHATILLGTWELKQGRLVVLGHPQLYKLAHDNTGYMRFWSPQKNGKKKTNKQQQSKRTTGKNTQVTHSAIPDPHKLQRWVLVLICWMLRAEGTLLDQWASEMVQAVRYLPLSLTTWVPLQENPYGRRRTDSHRLSANLHSHTEAQKCLQSINE